MRQHCEKKLNQKIEDFFPSIFTVSVGPEDIKKSGFDYALSIVFEKWLQLVDKMNDGLVTWLKSIGEPNPSEYHYDIWYRGVRSPNLEYCLTPKSQRHEKIEENKYSLLTIEHERTMFLDFERLSVGMYAPQTPSFWSTYFQIQRYGIRRGSWIGLKLFWLLFTSL